MRGKPPPARARVCGRGDERMWLPRSEEQGNIASDPRDP